MILFALILFFHIFLYNFLIPGIKLKQAKNKRLFEDLSVNLPSNYVCYNNVWTLLSYDNVDLDLLFIKNKNGGAITCNDKPDDPNNTAWSCITNRGFMPGSDCMLAMHEILTVHL